MMKVRFYPKKEVVREVLVESLTDTQRLVSETETKLTKLQDSAIYSAGNEAEVLQKLIDNNRLVQKHAEARLRIFDSADHTETMCELELA